MAILVIDTSAALCAACVFDPSSMRELGRAVLDLGKGHAEHVMAVIEGALAEAKLSYADLASVAVSIGPGSFTGVRVGVSAARGLALALKIPAMGVTTSEALAAETAALWPERAVLVVTKAGDRIALARFDAAGDCTEGPGLATLDEARELAKDRRLVLAGDMVSQIIEQADTTPDLGPQRATADIRFFAEVAARREALGTMPKPLYLRPADAKPSTNFALPLKGV